MAGKFGTSIECMDGRIQLPISDWIRKNYDVDFVDTITEPGSDKVISDNDASMMEQVKRKVLISVEKHKSNLIVVSGHHDCAGNPVSNEQHFEHIRNAVKVIKSWDLVPDVVGLWVNDSWQIDVVEK